MNLSIPESKPSHLPVMTTAFSDDNRVTWFVCFGSPSGLCQEIVERDLVTFQRSGRRDIVLARGIGPDEVCDASRAKETFGECRERLWQSPNSGEMYRVELESFRGREDSGYRLTSPEIVHVVLSAKTKAIGLLTDDELERLARKAFGAPKVAHG